MGCSNTKSALIDEKRVSVFAQFIQKKKENKLNFYAKEKN
jgi:hypothetical protein